MAEKTRTETSAPATGGSAAKLTAAIDKVSQRRAYYIGVGILLLAVIVGAVVLTQRDDDTDTTMFSQVWDRALAARDKLRIDTSAAEELALLEETLAEVRGTQQEGIALWLLGIYHYAEAFTSDKISFDAQRPHLEKAVAFLKELDERALFDELLLTKPTWFTSDNQPPTKRLYSQAKADLAWLGRYAKPAPDPAQDLVAVLRTSVGDIHFKFFRRLAPKHTENFVTLASLGTYNGTQFHFVEGGSGDPSALVGGDPLSFFYPKALEKKHILRWGEGGVGYDLAPEQSRFRVVHRRGIVSSQRLPDGDWDNAAQFRIQIKTDRDLDRKYTPFAMVVEGMNLVEEIARRKTASEHDLYRDDNDFASDATADLLVEPVEIYKVIIYRDGKAIEHKFDLLENEGSLATISGAEAQPIPEAKIHAGRKLRSVSEPGPVRKGLDIPFPQDLVADDDADENPKPDPLGDRKSK